MRTTVTLDPDVIRLLHERMHRQRQSFKESLNDAVRSGLRPPEPAPDLVVLTFDMGNPPGLGPAGVDYRRLDEQGEMQAAAPPARAPEAGSSRGKRRRG